MTTLAGRSAPLDNDNRSRLLLQRNDFLKLVDAELATAVQELQQEWRSVENDDGVTDILGEHDLVHLLGELVDCGGKRIRPLMTYCGWLSAGGRGRDSSGPRTSFDDVVRTSAALELLQAFALIHDDVMDESLSRRGRPAIHIQAAALHRAASAQGDATRFGESIAILVGDLAHAEADHLVSELPRPLRAIWRSLVVELVCGQRRDLVGSATGRQDLAYARSVSRMKSGCYTVERPLQLGAAAASASDAVQRSLGVYGHEVGVAFALRDDMLGIWGDPVITGKPAGDDLISAKPTIILALAKTNLIAEPAAAALARAGSPEFTARDLVTVQEAMRESGVAETVEKMITSHVDAALSALDPQILAYEGIELLTQLAHEIAWREK
ncbi:polyprenyl synthetase family protein [Nakamurella antarctica]|nr:polyprenyl synthetase family protein [Nakamurella antarctica]